MIKGVNYGGFGKEEEGEGERQGKNRAGDGLREFEAEKSEKFRRGRESGDVKNSLETDV